MHFSIPQDCLMNDVLCWPAISFKSFNSSDLSSDLRILNLEAVFDLTNTGDSIVLVFQIQ